MTRDWQNVIFSDESSFWAFSPQRKAWSVRGEPMLQRSVKHPLKTPMCVMEDGVQVLDWPSQSPDANPIEDVWALMKN
ncbi:hypothetical protein Trydic_g3581 [Trypoxylus dichotomus]